MTEALARISSGRPWITIGVWLLLVLVALGIVGQLLPTATTTELRIIPRFGEVGSVTASELLEGSPIEPPPAEVVIVHSGTLTVDDNAFKAKVQEVTGELRALEPEVIQASTNYYEVLATTPLDSLALVSSDRRSAIVAVQMTGTLGDALENIEEVIHVVEEADGRDGFDVLIVGDVSSRFEQAELSEKDLRQGEIIGLPVALLILLVLFGAVVAALIPVGLAVASIFITLAIVAVIGTIFGELVFFVLLWITMIGLAVGIDYSLIVVSRFREELARGLSTRDAVIKAGATASRTVFFSGMTVVIALLGVFIVPHTLFFATGLGAILVVIVSVMATLTFLPAMLTLLGPRVDSFKRPRLDEFPLLPSRRKAVAESSEGNKVGFRRLLVRTVVWVIRLLIWLPIVVFLLMVTLLMKMVGLLLRPFRRSAAAASSEAQREGFWEFITRKTMRYPVISILVVGGLMVWASVNYFGINTGFNSVETFPKDSHTREAFTALEEDFPLGYGSANPARVVIEGDINDPAVAAAVQTFKRSVVGDPAVTEALQKIQQAVESDPALIAALLQSNPEILNDPSAAALPTNTHGNLTVIAIPVPGAPSGAAAFDLIKRLRDDYIPAAFSGVPAEAHVGGISAEFLDFDTQLSAYLPIIFAFILGVSFILLLVVFRSIVIPIKAIIMNLLSVGAAYGLMVLVFQKGVGADLFGFQQIETIEAWLPLILFAILFGLSMDYHVFMLSRIRERYDQTHDNAESVAYGLRSTASLITGAALIMVAVFSGFASGDMVVNQQAGFGLAVAVLLDATLVRSILVPASMQLLGARNWYLPGFLNWLPQIQVEAEED